MVDADRVTFLNDRQPDPAGRYVLYWMQQSQRAQWNHALEYTATQANGFGLPAAVLFVLADGFPEANLRHYRFMLDGIIETAAVIERRGMRFILRAGHPPDEACACAKNAALVVCDRGYLRVQRAWREAAAAGAGCRVAQVESGA